MAAPDFVAQIKAAIATLTEPSLSPSATGSGADAGADIDSCDREPIHIPAAIQPHGVLLVLSEADWTIVQVSQNTADYLGKTPETLLGQPLSGLLNDAQMRTLQQCLAAAFETVNPLRFELEVGGTVQGFSGVVHRSDDAVLLELEPLEPEANQTAVSFFDFYSLVKQPVSRLQQTQTLAELCQTAADAVKQVSGFDRVMVYKFDPDGSGSVIAEALQPELSPFIGLHYPATDIPEQAKYLYVLNPLRLIPDVTYRPVPLTPMNNPLSDTPLDMSLSTLRSVSPLHIEYLGNMGVSATIAISLVQNHRLWGLIVGHHGSPRQLSYELRTICEFLGQVTSLELTAREEGEDAQYKIGLKEIQTSFIAALTQGQTLKTGLTHNPAHLTALTGSTGVAFYEKGEITLLGETPQLSEVSDLVRWVKEQFGQDVVYHTPALSQVYPAAAEFESGTSGLLALAISEVQQLYVLWFRPEVLQTVNWAGKPDKPVVVDPEGTVRMSPRQSFELWKETVRRRALPWKPCEIEAALELRTAVIGMVLQKADELSQLNSELTRSNIELDAFAYIASHDLKEPLRGIHNYSSFLIEDYGDQLGDDGAHKLQTLMRLTHRMEDLINSLLHYSRLGRAELSVVPEDLNEILDGVLDVVKISKPEQVNFVIPRALPTIACDRTQIIELFTNLISNSIKYNNKAEKSVEVGYLSSNEATAQGVWPAASQALRNPVFYVRDNGIGIRDKHLENVFRIFKRLHPPGRFGGGTGAGLTIVKKIVERHGGQIWINSVYGEGSTFYFTLENPINA
ncbi:MAG: ATP-binding protein [Cyanobacteria bacterium P01_A01_bin.114]